MPARSDAELRCFPPNFRRSDAAGAKDLYSRCEHFRPIPIALVLALWASLGCGGMGWRAAEAGAEVGTDAGEVTIPVDLCKAMGCCTKVDAGSAPVSASLCLDKYTASFGAVDMGKASSPIQFVVGNVGPTESGNISTIIAGSGFELKSSDCTTLSPGETCLVSVDFLASAPPCGRAMGTFTVSATPGGSISSDLEAVVTVSASFSLSPGMADFGNVVLGGSSSVAFTQFGGVCGISDYAFDVAGSSMSFAVDRSRTDCGTYVAAGAYCTIVVTFSPTAVGPASGALVTASGGLTFTASLTGNGVL